MMSSNYIGPILYTRSYLLTTHYDTRVDYSKSMCQEQRRNTRRSKPNIISSHVSAGFCVRRGKRGGDTVLGEIEKLGPHRFCEREF